MLVSVFWIVIFCGMWIILHLKNSTKRKKRTIPLPSFEPLYLLLDTQVKLFWLVVLLVKMRFELSSALMASFPKLFTLGLSSSSSCPVPGLLCQALTQMPVTIASQVGSYR